MTLEKTAIVSLTNLDPSKTKTNKKEEILFAFFFLVRSFWFDLVQNIRQSQTEQN